MTYERAISLLDMWMDHINEHGSLVLAGTSDCDLLYDIVNLLDAYEAKLEDNNIRSPKIEQ